MAAIDGNSLAISIRQGETVRFIFTQTRASDSSPIDITGDKFHLSVKKSAKATAPEVLFLNSDSPITDPVGSNPYDPSLPPTSSRIGVTDGPAGKWQIYLSAVKTGSLPSGDYVYEIDKLKSDGSVVTILYGDFTINSEVGS